MLARALAIASLFVVVPASVGAHQDPPRAPDAAATPQDGRKEVADLVAKLRATLGGPGRTKKAEPDFDPLVRCVHALDPEIARSGPKDRALIASALQDAVLALLPVVGSGTLGAYEAGFMAMLIGKCGEPGATALFKLHANKQVQASGDVFSGVHSGLGLIGSDEAFDVLFRAARTRERRSIHLAAADFAASTGFRGVDRKRAFDALLTGAKIVRADLAQVKKQNEKAAFESTLDAIDKALASLTRSRSPGVDAWEAWAKEHAKDEWSDEKRVEDPAPPKPAGK